jgi:hypothetical protein
MSEFQGYAFQAVDRSLDQKAMQELRNISSRAEITPTRFSNFYSYGSFKGNPREMMTRYFDAFVYVANWGTHRLMFRFPASQFDAVAAADYDTERAVNIVPAGAFVLLEFGANLEGGGSWLEEDAADGWLSALLPLRDDLLAGDRRALYLGWLAGVAVGEVDEEEVEPPVPPGLDSLTGALTELTDFLYLDDDLLEVAAETSVKAAPEDLAPQKMAAWVRALSVKEKDEMLLSVMQGEAPSLGRTLLHRYRQERAASRPAVKDPPRRTAGALRQAWEQREEQNRLNQEREKALERERQQRENAQRRERHLDSLAGQEENLWRQVEEAINTKQPKQYDQAVEYLTNLRDLAARGGQSAAFVARLSKLRAQHARKLTFIQRLDSAGLPG